MATVNSTSSTLFSFTVNASPYGNVTIEVRGSGFTYSGTTLTGGTLDSVTLNRFGDTSVMTDFLHPNAANYGAPGFVLPADTYDSVVEFLARFGDLNFALQSGESLTFFQHTEENVTLFGDDGNNYLTSGDGDDFIYGGAGNDDIRGSDGSDVIYGGTGNDDISTDGNFGFEEPLFSRHTIFGGAGDDDIYGGYGSDSFYGGAGTDSMYAGDSRDLLKGGGGRDFIGGGRGNDMLYGGGKGDLLYGGPDYRYGDEDASTDNDKLFGGGGADGLYGGRGNDDLFGGRGSDALEGGRGSDELFGGKGNDVLSSLYTNDNFSFIGKDSPFSDPGSPNARDVLKGGKGVDLFVFTENQEGRVVIDDFEDGRDLLQLLPDEAYNFAAEDTADSLILAQAQFKMFKDGASQKKSGVLFEGDNGSVMIKDMRLRDITVDDFLTATTGSFFFD